jgi:hypothetical protein
VRKRRPSRFDARGGGLTSSRTSQAKRLIDSEGWLTPELRVERPHRETRLPQRKSLIQRAAFNLV